MIKENKAAHAPPLLVCCCLSQSHIHTPFSPRALNITQFDGGLCSNLSWSLVIFTKPTHLIIPSQPNVHNSWAGLAPRRLKHTAPALSEANPLWCNTNANWLRWLWVVKANSNTYDTVLAHVRHLRIEINEEGWRILKLWCGRWILSAGRNGRKSAQNKNGRQIF